MTTDNDQANAALKEQPFVSHLLELRDRLLRALAVVALVFVALFPFANDLYTWVASPLMAHLPQGTSMIATEVASPFLTPFKLSLVAAVFLSMPYLLYQMWAFIAPGLYRHEKRLAVPLVASSAVLFYIGMLFAYYVVFPLVFAFLTGTVPDGVTVATDIAKYLDFILTLFFAFGLAFEVPIATFILVRMGVTTPDKLVEKRPYIIVGAFLVGMLLTPPDVISQTLLALPMWILFEVGLFFSRAFAYQPGEQPPQPAPDPPPPGSPSPESPAPVSGGATYAPAGSAAGWREQGAVADPVTEPARETTGEALDPDRFVPLTEAELEAELAHIEAEEGAYWDDEEGHDQAPMQPASQDPLTDKLRQVQQLRDADDEAGARRLLYEVLAEGDATQVQVARNILQQLDEA